MGPLCKLWEGFLRALLGHKGFLCPRQLARLAGWGGSKLQRTCPEEGNGILASSEVLNTFRRPIVAYTYCLQPITGNNIEPVSL